MSYFLENPWLQYGQLNCFDSPPLSFSFPPATASFAFLGEVVFDVGNSGESFVFLGLTLVVEGTGATFLTYLSIFICVFFPILDDVCAGNLPFRDCSLELFARVELVSFKAVCLCFGFRPEFLLPAILILESVGFSYV